MKLVQEEGPGKLYLLNEASQVYLLQLAGSWKEMGKQYGIFAKGKMDKMRDMLVAELKKTLDKETMDKDFAMRAYNAGSLRYRDLVDGVAEGVGWDRMEVLYCEMSGAMGIYQSKLQAFAGCTSLTAWGEASKTGGMITGRNMDWNEMFLQFPLFHTIYNPTNGECSISSLSWAGWLIPYTAVNDKGVYVDLHDGTSMGGAVVSCERPFIGSFLLDAMAEVETAEAFFHRFAAHKSDIPLIFTVADKTQSYSVECTLSDCRRRLPAPGESHLVVVNTFLNPDWGFHIRDTVSNSLTRLAHMKARAKENYGKFDGNKMKEIFDLRLFNEDGSFADKGGATKPTKQDADLTNYQMVCDIEAGKCFIKIPVPELLTEWIEIDNKALFLKK